MPQHYPEELFHVLELASAIRTGFRSMPEIVHRLKPVGLTDALRHDLNARIGAAQTAADTYIELRVAVEAMQKPIEKAETSARTLYVRHLDYARASVQRSDPSYDRLELSGRRRWASRDAWAAQARRMYQALADDPALQEAVSPFVIDPQQGLDALDALTAALAERQALRESARRARMERDAAIQQLKEHVRTIRTLAHHTLTETGHRSVLGLRSK